jgi:hypothetical protein
MDFLKKKRLEEFNKKYSIVSGALKHTFQKISGMHVKPWSFGLDSNGDVCGVIKANGIDEGTLNRLFEIAKKHGYGITLATTGECYRISKNGIKQVESVSCKDYVNSEITRFRMNLVSL